MGNDDRNEGGGEVLLWPLTPCPARLRPALTASPPPLPVHMPQPPTPYPPIPHPPIPHPPIPSQGQSRGRRLPGTGSIMFGGSGAPRASTPAHPRRWWGRSAPGTPTTSASTSTSTSATTWAVEATREVTGSFKFPGGAAGPAARGTQASCLHASYSGWDVTQTPTPRWWPPGATPFTTRPHV